MQIKTTGSNLKQEIEFLDSLTLGKAKENIARVRVISLLKNKFDEIEKDRIEVIKQFANLNEDGTPKTDGDKYDIPDDKLDDVTTAVDELKTSPAIIDGTEYETQLTDMKQALETYDQPLNGGQAQVLVCLIDAIQDEKGVD